jgi:putative flavoprotein involved in K+ transport
VPSDSALTTLDPSPGAPPEIDPEPIVSAWLGDFASALASGDPGAVSALFVADGWWRDLLAVTWDLRTAHGADQIRALVDATPPPSRVTSIDRDGPATLVSPPGQAAWIQSFFRFETAIARGRGVVRLRSDDQAMWSGWTVFTSMQELKGYEEPSGPRRPGTDGESPWRSRTWLDGRIRGVAYTDREPRVLIVGGGHSGLALAARLGQLDVDTLVVERNPRIGDNWRRRYRSLVLHDPVWYDHLPYVPFPLTWPIFTPKDKLGDWLEHYASIMELNIWTDTELVDSHYDEAEHRWTITTDGPNGKARVVRPTHVVLATGAAGDPRLPTIPGAAEFRGTIVHSSAYEGGTDATGIRSLVVGAGNSGHDIAQDLFEHGADVTLLQRSGTAVMSAAKGLPVFFGGLYAEDGPPVEDADLLSASLPHRLAAEFAKDTTRVIAELDRDLLDGLAAAGFRVDFGDDGSGMFMKFLERGGGYYLDVGCSSLIAQGDVMVKHGVEIAELTETTVVFADGTETHADLVVFATGYDDMRSTARRLLGDAVAERCGPVWGLDEEGELRGVWRRSGHPGLWFMAGNLALSRMYSRHLALQIKAIEAGLLAQQPPESRALSHPGE